jgi:hypothetical protein
MDAGECTLHSRHCGAGIGVWLFLQKASIVLMTCGQACHYGHAIFLDKHHTSSRKTSLSGQNRPLYLSEVAYKKLEGLYMNHHVTREVIRSRASAQDHLIRLNAY